MGRDILGEYGPESPRDAMPRKVGGGVTMGEKRDVMGYQPPQGPSNIRDGNGPGLHGKNYGACGSQGYYDLDCPTSGKPGIGGENRGMGTNRRG